MSISNRRDRIKQIITQREVGRQEELVEILQSEGFNVTQATVSRDIKELGLIKIKGNNLKSKYSLPSEVETNSVSLEKVITLLKTFMISIESAQNLVVIKTIAGNGSSCGMAVDNLKIEGVVGSIAGDDTLLVVTHSTTNAERVVKFIENLVK